MPQKTREELKQYFETGDKPNQDQYGELIDAFRHVDEKLPIADVESLQVSLDSKASTAALINHINDNSLHSASMTGAEIKTAYEAEANTNAFTDVEKQQVADGVAHRADSAIHVTTGDKTAWNNKLDSGGFSGSATDLKNEIDGKVTMNPGGDPAKVFNELGNAVALPSFVANTYFLDATNGNDSTGEFQNMDKPYQTLDAILDLYQGQTQSQTLSIIIVILDTETYQLTKQLQQIFNIRFYSEFACTIDLSNFDFANAPVQNNNVVFVDNQSVLPNLTFDLPNGTIQNLTSTSLKWGGEDYSVFLNVKEVINLSTSPLFFCSRLVQTNRSMNFRGSAPLYSTFTNNDISDLYFKNYTIENSVGSYHFNGTNKVTIQNLHLDNVSNTQNFTMNLNHLILGNVTGTNSNITFWYHSGNTTLEFNHSDVDVPIYFQQSLGNVTFTGTVERFSSITGSVFSPTVVAGNRLSLENLIIKAIDSGEFYLNGETYLDIRNTIVESPGRIFRINKGGNCKIINLTSIQNVPTKLIEVTDAAAITAYNVQGNYTTLQ
jgi:hypothetical protein